MTKSIFIFDSISARVLLFILLIRQGLSARFKLKVSSSENILFLVAILVYITEFPRRQQAREASRLILNEKEISKTRSRNVDIIRFTCNLEVGREFKLYLNDHIKDLIEEKKPKFFIKVLIIKESLVCICGYWKSEIVEFLRYYISKS